MWAMEPVAPTYSRSKCRTKSPGNGFGVEAMVQKRQKHRRLGASQGCERGIVLFPGDRLAEHLLDAVERNRTVVARGGDTFVDGQRLLF